MLPYSRWNKIHQMPSDVSFQSNDRAIHLIMFSKFPLMPHKFYLTNQSMLLSLMRQFKSFISAHKKSTIVYQSLHFLHCIYHLVNVSLFFLTLLSWPSCSPVTHLRQIAPTTLCPLWCRRIQWSWVLGSNKFPMITNCSHRYTMVQKR
jgi:hypothetical protein